MEHCTSGGCQILQKYPGNASGRQTPCLYVKPMQNCSSFVPAGAVEQGMWLCFSYDQSHVAYTEMKPMWVWSLVSPVHRSMGKKKKKRELNSCPISKERNVPLQQVAEWLSIAVVHLLCPIMSKFDTPQTVFLEKGGEVCWTLLI